MMMIISDADDKYSKLFQFLLVKLWLVSSTLFIMAIWNPAIKRMYFLKLAKRLERNSSSGII